jgi:hypothetical protein
VIQRHQVQANGFLYTVSPDDNVSLAARCWGVVQVRLRDEITGEPVRTQTGIRTEYRGLRPRVAGDGLVGLVGVPRVVFPDLPNQGYDVPFTVTATGYLPVALSAAVPQDAQFPVSFSPSNLAVAMHAEAVTLRGRVVRPAAGGFAPVAGAAVRITGMRRHPVPANAAPPPLSPPNLVSLQPGVHANRPAGGGMLRRRNGLTGAIGKRTLRIAVPGDRTLHINNRVGLGPGDLVRIDGGQPERVELHTIASIAGASGADQPAVLSLDYALRIGHPAGTEVSRLLPQPPGPALQIQDETLAGDLCLPLNGLTGIAAGNVVEISGGANPPEYQIVRMFAAVSDAQGNYRLPPLGRVAEVRLEAAIGAQMVERDISPNYRLGRQTVDLILP